MKDQRSENYLGRGGYAYKFVSKFPLKHIDLEQAALNPARIIKRLDEDRVVKMWLDMEEGVDFPAIVVFLLNDGTYELVTGLHRCSAAKHAGLDVLDAYVVTEPNEYRRAILPRSINVIEGRAPTHQENLQQIAEILRLFPDAAQADLALAFGVKQPAISDFLKLNEYEMRADRLGCRDYWMRLPSGLRMKLGRVVNDNVFKETVQVMVRAKINGRVAEDLIGTVRKARTEAVALGVLQDVMQQYEAEQKRNKRKWGRQLVTTPTRWMRAVRSLWKFLSVWEVSRLHLPDLAVQQREANIEIIGETITQLVEAKQVLEQERDRDAGFKVAAE